MDSDELSLVSGTEHHGGICMLVKKQRTFYLQGYLDVPRQEDCLVVLDQVNNAQNLGGVVRTCAFYGIKNVVTNQVEQLYAPAAMRVAEGGMQHIRILETESTEIALEALRKAGYQIIHVSTNKQGVALEQLKFAEKVALVLSEGSTDDIREKQDVNVRLSLSNPLKSRIKYCSKYRDFISTLVCEITLSAVIFRFVLGLTSVSPFSFSKLYGIQILIFLLKAFGGIRQKIYTVSSCYLTGSFYA